MLPDGMSSDLVRTMLDIFGERLLSVVLYGSVARGEQTDESDIDVAVFLREPLAKEEKKKCCLLWWNWIGSMIACSLSTILSRQLSTNGRMCFRIIAISKRRVSFCGKPPDRS